MKYVQIDKSILALQEAVLQYPWLETALTNYKQPATLQSCVIAVYYIADLKTQTLTDHFFVTTWNPEYKHAFRQLNEHWVTKFFKMEKSDYNQLDNPEETILAFGGEIFFLLSSNGKPIGTVAMFIHEGMCELAKMAVDESCQGKGYANFIIREALRWAFDRRQTYPDVTILTNSKLHSAVRLYEKYGFRIIHRGPHPGYERVNVVMQLVHAA